MFRTTIYRKYIPLTKPVGSAVSSHLPPPIPFPDPKPLPIRPHTHNHQHPSPRGRIRRPSRDLANRLGCGLRALAARSHGTPSQRGLSQGASAIHTAPLPGGGGSRHCRVCSMGRVGRGWAGRWWTGRCTVLYTICTPCTALSCCAAVAVRLCNELYSTALYAQGVRCFIVLCKQVPRAMHRRVHTYAYVGIQQRHGGSKHPGNGGRCPIWPLMRVALMICWWLSRAPTCVLTVPWMK